MANEKSVSVHRNYTLREKIKASSEENQIKGNSLNSERDK